MKTQAAIAADEICPFWAYLLKTKPMEDKGNGNRNPPPAPNLQIRPISVLLDWGPASYPDSRLPASLADWLASEGALTIGWPAAAEPALMVEMWPPKPSV
jgi:hypothetical protein